MKKGDVCVNWNVLKRKIEAFFSSNSLGRQNTLSGYIWVHTYTELYPFYINVSAQGSVSRCSDGWVGRLRGPAEIVDNPPADLTGNHPLRCLGRMENDLFLSFFVAFFLFHLSLSLLPSIYLTPPLLCKKQLFFLVHWLNINIPNPPKNKSLNNSDPFV